MRDSGQSGKQTGKTRIEITDEMTQTKLPNYLDERVDSSVVESLDRPRRRARAPGSESETKTS